MHYRTLLFDLDHTLLDSDASQSAALVHAFRSVGVDDAAAYRSRFDEINGELWARVERGDIRPDQVRFTRFERLVADTALDVDPIALADGFVAGLGMFGGLLDGAREMLEALSARARLAMVTNGLGDVQRTRIARLDLDRYFDAIVVSGEVGTAKPDTAIFELTFEKLGTADRGAALMIGDSLSSDIAGGANAGIDTCWFNPRMQVAPTMADITHEIARLDQVPGLATDGVVR